MCPVFGHLSVYLLAAPRDSAGVNWKEPTMIDTSAMADAILATTPLIGPLVAALGTLVRLHIHRNRGVPPRAGRGRHAM